jgi:Zn-dependent alcohol dehydrogenase
VLGVGDPGHIAIELLRVLAPVTIVAADVDDKKLAQAKALGADHIVNNRNADDAAERIQKIATRERLRPLALPPLRQTQLAVATALGNGVSEETSLIVDSIETMAELLVKEVEDVERSIGASRPLGRRDIPSPGAS